MTWNPEELEKIPAVYRDFLLALKPIIDSRNSAVRIAGIPIGHLYSAIAFRHGYDLAQVTALARNLVSEGYVEMDKLGFYKPTGKGEDLILAIAGEPLPENANIPPFPKLAESA
jgi:hypothetical protein